MVTKVNTITKRYSSAFVLDRAKLTRMLEILEDKFESAQLEFKPSYEILDSKGKNVNLNELEDVLKLDNPIRNPIASFTIKAEDGNASCKISYENNERKNILLKVTSQDAKWVNELFANIEEQIERTFASGLRPNFPVFSSEAAQFFSALIGTLSIILATIISVPFLRINDGNSVAGLVKESQQLTTTEEKINFLFEQKVRELQESLPSDELSAPSTYNWHELLTLRNLFLILPFLIVFGCLAYLFMRCYPHAVFLWGDYKEHYEGILSTRSKLWNAVILTIVLGVVVNGFSGAIAEFITD